MKIMAMIVFVLGGVCLILAPAVYDYMLNRNVTNLLIVRTDFTSVSTGQPMADFYRLVCWVCGVLLFVLAIPAANAIGRQSKS